MDTERPGARCFGRRQALACAGCSTVTGWYGRFCDIGRNSISTSKPAARLVDSGHGSNTKVSCSRQEKGTLVLTM